MLVEGRPGQRPIDALVQNFHDVYQSLLVAAAGPGSGQGGDANLPIKLQSLRANASRLPRVLAGLVLSAANEFETNAAETSLEQLGKTLARNVSGPCHDILDNKYPFTPGASAEVPLPDFARLFAPGGIIDRYFAQNLAPFVDVGGKDWLWRRETRLGRELSSATLRQFQLAAEIRDAFFRPGEPTPSIRIAILPTALNADIDMALLSVDGQIVQGYQSGSSATTVTWPGGATGSANLSFTPALPGRQSVLGFQGSWAIRRLLQAGSAAENGDGVDVRFVIGGRDAAYKIRAEPGPNPFLLPALSEFSCPSGF
jgi:type VI secretion system protein ImpL